MGHYLTSAKLNYLSLIV